LQSRRVAGTPDMEERPKTFLSQKSVSYIGVPFCEGQNLEGADLAPVAIREAGLQTALARIGWGWDDRGDINFAAHFAGEKKNSRTQLGRQDSFNQHHHSVELYRQWIGTAMQENFSTWVRNKRPRTESEADLVALEKEHGTGVARVDKPPKIVNAELIGSGLKLVYDKVAAAALSRNFVLTVGGDHSIAAGSISALSTVYPDLGVIWIDAHADANTPDTSPSMHYHGMPAAHLLGWFDKTRPVPGFDWFPSGGCLDENRLAYIGLRDIDKEEGRMLRQSNVHVFTMRDVDKHGIAKVIEMAMQAIDPNGRRPLHLSLDIDAVDPYVAPGTGTCARGGLGYREIHYVCEELALSRRLVSMDLVEVNPALDVAPADQMHGDDPSIKASPQTVQLAVELTLSALGKTILPL